MQNPTIFINGKLGDRLSSLDRGLLYGDGVFETIAFRKGYLQFWDEHIARLNDGCDVLGITGLDNQLLIKEVEQLTHSGEQCVIKIIITRGIGDRGYKPNQLPATRIIQKFSFPDFPASYTEQGIDVTLCSYRLSQQTKLSKIKHLNRLEQVLARSEWDDEFQEGLVCDANNHVIEATSSNVFFECDNALITPDLNLCGVEGVLRNVVLKYCNDNYVNFEVRDINLNEVENFPGMFVCNSIIGIWPVKSFNQRPMSKTAIITNLMSEFNS
ncbi:MAG: aminodeoxychorismate lyase [Gammaproteobacteria bacterium]